MIESIVNYKFKVCDAWTKWDGRKKESRPKVVKYWGMSVARSLQGLGLKVKVTLDKLTERAGENAYGEVVNIRIKGVKDNFEMQVDISKCSNIKVICVLSQALEHYSDKIMGMAGFSDGI